MDVNVRPELSEKNKYWISRHRYYELKHFCRQYPEWKKEYDALRAKLIHSPNLTEIQHPRNEADPTGDIAVAMESLGSRILLIDDVARLADPELKDYILQGVTKGLSYDVLKARLEIPCCKDVYYETYRKFFWLLDKARN